MVDLKTEGKKRLCSLSQLCDVGFCRRMEELRWAGLGVCRVELSVGQVECSKERRVRTTLEEDGSAIVEQCK